MTTPSAFGVRIAGVGSCVPEGVLTNADLEKMVDTTDEWIVQRTGIRSRHVLPDDWTTSDLAVAAAEAAIADADIPKSAIDLLILATVTPDHICPSTACVVQVWMHIFSVMTASRPSPSCG